MRSELRIQIGVAIATSRIHHQVSRELMIWLDCYEFQNTPFLEPALHSKMLAYHQEKQIQQNAMSCTWISGNDQTPWKFAVVVSDILPAICYYYTIQEQMLIADRII